MHELSMIDRAMVGILITAGGVLGGYLGVMARKPVDPNDEGR